MKINLPDTLDNELLNRPGDEYFMPWLKKHRPDLVSPDKPALVKPGHGNIKMVPGRLNGE